MKLTNIHMQKGDYAEWSVAGNALTEQDILDRNLWKNLFHIVCLPTCPIAWVDSKYSVNKRMLIVSFFSEQETRGPLKFFMLPIAVVEEIEVEWSDNVFQQWEFDYPGIDHKHTGYVPKIIKHLAH